MGIGHNLVFTINSVNLEKFAQNINQLITTSFLRECVNYECNYELSLDISIHFPALISYLNAIPLFCHLILHSSP